MHELISLRCTAGVEDADTCPCQTQDMTTFQDGAAYLGTQGPAEWPAHVWRRGEPWITPLPPKVEDPMRAVENLGPIGPVHMAEAIRLYEHEPFVPLRIVPVKPVIPAWSEIDPEPEVTTRTPIMMPMPTRVGRLARLARSHGFEVRCGYALCEIRGQARGDYRHSETWSVQGRGPGLFTAIYERNPDGRQDRGDLRACDHERKRDAKNRLIACARCKIERGGWSWDRITVSLAGRTFPYADYTDLTIWIAAEGAPGDLWRYEILKRERAKAEKDKARPVARKKIEDGG